MRKRIIIERFLLNTETNLAILSQLKENPDLANDNGTTPLILAARSRKMYSRLTILLQMTKNINHQDRNGNSGLNSRNRLR